MITIEVVHRFDLPPGMCSEVSLAAFQALETQMAKTIDELNSLKSDFDAAVARINADTTNFQTSIQTLKDQVLALETELGNTTPEVQAIFDSIRASIVQLDPDPSNPPVEPPPAP